MECADFTAIDGMFGGAATISLSVATTITLNFTASGLTGATSANTVVSPATARTIAHPISFIRTPVTWVGIGAVAARAPDLGGLIGAAFRPLKRQFQSNSQSVEAAPSAAYSPAPKGGGAKA